MKEKLAAGLAERTGDSDVESGTSEIDEIIEDED